ncbi:MAG: sigma-70 family RNA polymerase sigma factor [Phycisphaeraceae bacterium]|nr:sigma-70 family RNA polymerase sigma factor [Phycisphaeraceae bacterium]
MSNPGSVRAFSNASQKTMAEHGPSESSLPSEASQSPDVTLLLRAASEGDEAAWRSLVGLYARRVYALAKSRLGRGIAAGGGSWVSGSVSGHGPETGGFARQAGGGRRRSEGCELAEEITQSVFVTVASKLVGGGYTEQGRFESWLFRVAMNRIRDEVRRARRQAAPTDPEALNTLAAGETGPDDERPAMLDALRSALERLADTDREVIELRHHAGMSFKQIADLLEEPIGTLLARHHRALRKLKDIMTAGGATPALAGLNGGD